MSVAKIGLLAYFSAVAIAGQIFPVETAGTEPKINYLGWTPKPTAAPLLGGHHDLFKRQNVPNTECGVLLEDSNQAFTCGTGYCGFNSIIDGFGCCASTTVEDGTTSLASCNIFTECNDYDAGCDDACYSNPNFGACLSTDRPYCVKYTLFAVGSADTSSYSYYGCTSVSDVGVVTLLSTLAGAVDPSGSGSASSSASRSSRSAASSSSSEDEESSTTRPRATATLVETPGPGGAGLTGTLQPMTESSQSQASVSAAATSSTSSAAAAGVGGGRQYSLVVAALSWVLGLLA